MESIPYGDNPLAIRWYRTVFGGKADELSLEEAFSEADEATIFVVPTAMLQTFQGMIFILGKRVGIKEMTPETPPFEFNNYSSIDAVYPYSLSFLRHGKSDRRDPQNVYFAPDDAVRRGLVKHWRERGQLL